MSGNHDPAQLTDAAQLTRASAATRQVALTQRIEAPRRGDGAFVFTSFYPACIVSQWLVLRWPTTGRRFRSSSKNEVFVGALRPLSVDIPLRRDDPTSPSRECRRGDASPPRNRCETRGAHRRSCTSSATERRAWPEHADNGSSARKLLSRTRGTCENRLIRSSRRLSRDPRRLDNVAPPIRDGCHCRRSFAFAVVVAYHQTCRNAPTRVWQCAISRIGRTNTWIIVEPEVETAGPITH